MPSGMKPPGPGLQIGKPARRWLMPHGAKSSAGAKASAKRPPGTRKAFALAHFHSRSFTPHQPARAFASPLRIGGVANSDVRDKDDACPNPGTAAPKPTPAVC